MLIDENTLEPSGELPEEEEPSGELEDEIEEDESFEDEEEGEQEDPEPETFEINGQKVTREELINGYMRQSDYSRKTEDLKRMKEELLNRNTVPEKPLDPKTLAVKKQLSELGFVSGEEVDQKLQQVQIRASINAEKDQVRKATGASDTIIDAAQFVRARRRSEGIEASLEEIVRELQGSGKKVVTKKTVGLQGGKPTSPTAKGYATYTNAQIEALDPMSKEFEKVMALEKAGKLKII